MKKLLPVLAVLFFSILQKNAAAQPISGTVNTYTAVNTIAGNVLTVTSAAGFSAGDRVLIIQMKGATINNSNSSSFGNITAYNNVGNNEFNAIASVSGNNITVTSALVNSYTTTEKVQLVRIPQYTNPTITGNITCPIWNGTVGGVIVLEACGTITMDADIVATISGFRGQAFCVGGFGCGTSNYYYNNTGCLGAKKGEGVAEYLATQDGGRGKQANGGGGGNPGNSGAGGGGNGGAGGTGGFEYSGCGATNIFGIGGLALDYSVERAMFGGAGGTGFNDNSQTVTIGGNGGGIVFINANEIIANNHSIITNGGNVTVIAGDESAGGGGAGGTVLMRVNTYSGNLTINANGGYGGSTYNNIFVGDCHGPGGGGGGGLIWFSQSSTPAGVTVTSTPGAPGLVLNPASICYNTSFGASVGFAGTTKYNVSPVSVPLPPLTVDLGPDVAKCQGQDIVIDAGSGYLTYLWQDGSTNQTITATTGGTFSVSVTSPCGTGSDAINVLEFPNPVVNLGNDTTLCIGETLLLDLSNVSGDYLWQDGSTNLSYTVNTAGVYWLQVTSSAFGCFASDTMEVFYNSPASLNLGNDTSICSGQFLILNAANTGSVFNWSTGETTQTITVNSSGNYVVTVSLANCVSVDSILINVLPLPVFSLGPDIFSCAGNTVSLNTNYPSANYLWSTTETTQMIQVNSSGNYSAMVTDNGCSSSDSVLVTFLNNPVVNLGNDTSLCSGQNLILDASNAGAVYSWSNSSTAQTISVINSGNYSVTVDLSGCMDSDTINVLFNPVPVINLGADLDLCSGSVANLDAGNPGASFLWSTAETTQLIQPNSSGNYSVTVIANNCSATDNVQVNFQNPPIVNLGNDQSLCIGSIAFVDAGNAGANYSWSTGENSQSISISQNGIYTVTVTTGPCSATDNVQIIFTPLPVFELGLDTSICTGQSIQLIAGISGMNYNWSTGENQQIITVSVPGIYSVIVTDVNGCSSTDAVSVDLFCEGEIFVPNAFSPNGDEINDLLFVYGNNISELDFYVFTRWGELVFESHDVADGWDGYFKGDLVNPGVFVYYCNAIIVGGTQKILKGDITVLR